MLTLDEVLSDFRMYVGLADTVPINVRSRSERGQSPLHWMATLGDDNAIRLLTNAGADLNGTDASGNTALHEAVAGRHVFAAIALLKSGASLEIRNGVGETPWDVACKSGYIPIIDLLQLRAPLNFHGTE